MVRRIVAENVCILRDRQYRSLPDVTARNTALGKRVGSSLGQMQRICAGTLGTSIDTLEWLALALGVSTHQLLIPNFAASLDPLPTAPSRPPRIVDDDSLQRRHG